MREQQEKQETFVETKREVIDGYIYQSENGQLVVDACAGDVQHLQARATHAETPLHRCRTYVADVIPYAWRGKRGKILLDRTVLPDGEVISVQISFIPAG